MTTLVQIMAWRRPGDKPLSEPMVVSLLTHVCIIQPQLVKCQSCTYTVITTTADALAPNSARPSAGTVLSIKGDMMLSVSSAINTLRPRQNGCHFPDNFFKCIFFHENIWVSIKISLTFVSRAPINNIPALVQINGLVPARWQAIIWIIHG